MRLPDGRWRLFVASQYNVTGILFFFFHSAYEQYSDRILLRRVQILWLTRRRLHLSLVSVHVCACSQHVIPSILRVSDIIIDISNNNTVLIREYHNLQFNHRRMIYEPTEIFIAFVRSYNIVDTYTNAIPRILEYSDYYSCTCTPFL
jgi:hypothetical protein